MVYEPVIWNKETGLSMVIDYEWNGIMKHKYDVCQSLKEYGFAFRFASKKRGEHFYECLIPDEDKSYYLCSLSVEDVRDVVDEHPELPLKPEEVDKTDIGELLYMLDLYCDIYDIWDIKKNEKIEYCDLEFNTAIPSDSIDSEENPKRKKIKSLSMTREKAETVIDIINRYELNRRYSYYNILSPKERLKLLPKIDNTKIAYCKRILSLCGETVESFIKKIKIDSDILYWMKDGKYIELK